MTSFVLPQPKVWRGRSARAEAGSTLCCEEHFEAKKLNEET
jgi:hypothetical protein